MCRTTEAIQANHDDVEENGWDGPMPSRPALADDAARRSLARSVMAHEDRAALLLTVAAMQKRLDRWEPNCGVQSVLGSSLTPTR